MEELLLPSGEEAPSEAGSFAPAEKEEERSLGRRLKRLVVDLRRRAKNFLKRNGLLTLSVLAVLTGCVLGFSLRGSQLSTQVGPQGGLGPPGRTAGGLRTAR